MLTSRHARTGIDIGSSSIKLVRGLGDRQLTTLTHFGREPWAGGDDEIQAATALQGLLNRLGLERKHLGRIAVALEGWDGGCKEVVSTALSDDEFAQALPFEARRFLSFEEMEDPVIAGHVLGPAEVEPDGGSNRVMLAAVPGASRDFLLSVLDRVALEPAVIDLEPLAGLNALFASGIEDDDGREAVGLLDLGAAAAGLAIACRSGGMICRVVGPGLPDPKSVSGRAEYTTALAERVAETLTYFRGRFHRRVGALHLAGGGALLPDLSSGLACALECSVELARPFASFSSATQEDEDAALFHVACGLCEWGDEGHV